MLGLSFGASAQDQHYVAFSVQVAASKVPIAKTHKLYTQFEDLKEVAGDDGYYRYMTGNFESAYEAENYLRETVKPTGYKDAYVMANHKGKLMTVDQAIDFIYSD